MSDGYALKLSQVSANFATLSSCPLDKEEQPHKDAAAMITKNRSEFLRLFLLIFKSLGLEYKQIC
jgi:hypothetical protein